MSREVILGGMSDDIHTLVVDGVKKTTLLREYVIHLTVAPGLVVRATMEYDGEQWQCRITAPEDTKVEIDGELCDRSPIHRPASSMAELREQVREVVRTGSKLYPGDVYAVMMSRGNGREQVRRALLELIEENVLTWNIDREVVVNDRG